MSGIATAIVGSAVIGGYASNKAAQNSADAMRSASADQIAMTGRIMEQEKPWMQAGQMALGQITAGMAPGGEFNKKFTSADIVTDPGYQFRLQQGEKSIAQSASAHGMTLSGATLTGMQDYSQGSAAQQYQQAFQNWQSQQTNDWNRLMQVSNQGEAAAAGQAVNLQNLSNNQTDLTLGGAQAKNKALLGTVGVVGNAIGQYGQYQMNSSMNRSNVFNPNAGVGGGTSVDPSSEQGIMLGNQTAGLQ